MRVALNLADKIVHVLALERQVATNESVQEDSYRPHVGLLVVTLVEHLWRHVVGCAHDLGIEEGAVADLGQTEINQTNIVGLGQHNVFRLDVAVDHAVCVAVVES